MEPLAITCSVVTLTHKCLSTARTLHTLRERYKDAAVTITAFATECTVTSASLGSIQNLVLRKPDALESTLRARPELVEVLDTCLTGCMLAFSILDTEVQKLVEQPESVGTKVGLLWKAPHLNELLHQIRGQQAPLGLLIQTLQLESLSDIKSLLKSKRKDINAIVERNSSLRKQHPKVKAPASIRAPTAMAEDNASIFSADTMFDFDDELMNAAAYRRMLFAKKVKSESLYIGPAEDKNLIQNMKETLQLKDAELREASRQHEFLKKGVKERDEALMAWKAWEMEVKDNEVKFRDLESEMQRVVKLRDDEIDRSKKELEMLRSKVDLHDKIDGWSKTYQTVSEELQRQHSEITTASSVLAQNARNELDKSREENRMLCAINDELNKKIVDLIEEGKDSKYKYENHVARLIHAVEEYKYQENEFREDIENAHKKHAHVLSTRDAEIRSLAQDLEQYRSYDAIIQQLHSVSMSPLPKSIQARTSDGAKAAEEANSRASTSSAEPGPMTPTTSVSSPVSSPIGRSTDG